MKVKILIGLVIVLSYVLLTLIFVQPVDAKSGKLIWKASKGIFIFLSKSVAGAVADNVVDDLIEQYSPPSEPDRDEIVYDLQNDLKLIYKLIDYRNNYPIYDVRIVEAGQKYNAQYGDYCCNFYGDPVCYTSDMMPVGSLCACPIPWGYGFGYVCP